MQPILSVLVPALSSRDWKPLVRELDKQCRCRSQTLPPVEVLVEEDNGEHPSGIKRQRLMDRAKGQYLAFVDDDDWVAANYIRAITTACYKGFDVVTFGLVLGKEIWHYRHGPDQRREGLMAANHLCAWRAELARRVGWCPYLGYGDDQLWYKPLHASGLIVSSWEIKDVLYSYRYHPATTRNQLSSKVKFSRNYAKQGLSCYWLGEEIVIQAGGEAWSPSLTHDTGHVAVINSKGVKIEVPLDSLREFAKVHIV